MEGDRSTELCNRPPRKTTRRGRSPGRDGAGPKSPHRAARLSHPELLDALVQSAAQLRIAVLDLRNKPRRTLHFKSQEALLQALRHTALHGRLGREALQQAEQALAQWDTAVRRAG